MAYFRTYSIDDIVSCAKPAYSRNLGYFAAKSEDKAENTEKTQYFPAFVNSKGAEYQNNRYDENEGKTTTYYTSLRPFLKEQRPETRFISVTEDVQCFIDEAFGFAASQKMPENIMIKICSKDELRQIHSEFGSWSDNIQGFAINGKKSKKIFVKNSHLDELMLTIGHEIGHVFTPSLNNSHDEEAKAFAFAVKWAEAIRENNIGNLSSCIKENIDFQPARNGLHDIAFLFVKNLLRKKDAMQIHWDLAKKYISMWNFYG